ncbi:Uncharacterised protein [Yersinia frederiksenii]|jgi:hypothetical protein|nr:Uncharacterised protein [Yersinia frederiksenii]CNL58500.1 Uncharacterised protein [Yersinia frederiksenii]CQJ00560.1 Uncharacterised protein [Yersinia frederiksenii]
MIFELYNLINKIIIYLIYINKKHSNLIFIIIYSCEKSIDLGFVAILLLHDYDDRVQLQCF